MKYLAIGNPSAPKGTITTILNGAFWLAQAGSAAVPPAGAKGVAALVLRGLGTCGVALFLGHKCEVGTVAAAAHLNNSPERFCHHTLSAGLALLEQVGEGPAPTTLR